MGRLLRVPGYPISVQSIIFPRPDGVGQAPTSESVTLHSPTGARGDCPAACLVGHQSDMVSFRVGSGLFQDVLGSIKSWF